jgi:Cu-Zn family superoxide dismutase
MVILKKSRLLALAAVLLVVAPAVAVEAGAGEANVPTDAKARLHDAQGNTVGTVRFISRSSSKVTVRARTMLLPPGFHGFHVHAVGLCEPPFTSAGGHFNPTSEHHGHHAGDLPVLFVADDGGASAEFDTDAFSVDQLLDADGSAVIVHAAADNYANIPTRYSSTGPDATTLATGDSGARIACGVVGSR